MMTAINFCMWHTPDAMDIYIHINICIYIYAYVCVYIYITNLYLYTSSIILIDPIASMGVVSNSTRKTRVTRDKTIKAPVDVT